MNLSELMNQVLIVLPIPLFCTFKDLKRKKKLVGGNAQSRQENVTTQKKV